MSKKLLWCSVTEMFGGNCHFSTIQPIVTISCHKSGKERRSGKPALLTPSSHPHSSMPHQCSLGGKRDSKPQTHSRHHFLMALTYFPFNTFNYYHCASILHLNHLVLLLIHSFIQHSLLCTRHSTRHNEIKVVKHFFLRTQTHLEIKSAYLGYISQYLPC